MSSYNVIIDPTSGQKFSLFDYQGKQILNNYFKHFQQQQRQQQSKRMNGGSFCQSDVNISQQYSEPCASLPLDHAFATLKGGKRSKKRKNVFRQKRSVKK